MDASVASPPAAPPAAVEPEAPATEAPTSEAPAPDAQPKPVAPGTVHLVDGKSVEVTSIEHFLEQMAGDAGEAWVKVEQAGGKTIAFLKSAVVAHE